MKCHICGCTEKRACAPGCCWVHRDGALPLCSVCDLFLEQLAGYCAVAHSVSVSSLARSLAAVRRGGRRTKGAA